MTEFDLVIVAAVAGIYLTCGIAGVLILVSAWRKPENDQDQRLSAVDDDLTERERAARWLGGGWRT